MVRELYLHSCIHSSEKANQSTHSVNNLQSPVTHHTLVRCFEKEMIIF